MSSITLALAKGRPAEDTINLLEKNGIQFPDFHEDSRKLIFYNTDQTIQLLFVKGVDVTTYVEKGAADVGIVGKDNILEAKADVYEMLDLQLGICKFVLAGHPDHQVPKHQTPIIATKYPEIAKKHFNRKGQQIEIIKLNGSVELAPLIGLSDYIVDITETGNTLKENSLEIMEELDPISTRLIVNKASFATKSEEVQRIINQLKSSLE